MQRGRKAQTRQGHKNKNKRTSGGRFGPMLYKSDIARFIDAPKGKRGNPADMFTVKGETI